MVSESGSEITVTKHPLRCETCFPKCIEYREQRLKEKFIVSRTLGEWKLLTATKGCASHSSVLKEWDSKRLIGDVHERYENVKHHGKTHTLKGEDYDWNSFYTGWLEGRLDFLGYLREKLGGPYNDK